LIWHTQGVLLRPAGPRGGVAVNWPRTLVVY
jgi:hypothetical protein